MEPTLLLITLKKILDKTASWIKILVSNKKNGKTVEINNGNIVEFGKVIKSSSNINQTVINININTNDPSYNRNFVKEILGDIGQEIDKHGPYGLTFGDETYLSRSSSLNETQISTLKHFKDLNWPKVVLDRLALSYRIINLEDKGDVDGTAKLRRRAFESRYGSEVRKLYNLARAGYMEEFFVNSIVSPIEYKDNRIIGILKDFPRAIFVDEGSVNMDIYAELSEREQRNIPEVTMYARGLRIATMDDGYYYYIANKIQYQNKQSTVKFYNIDREEKYKIGMSNAKKTVLFLKEGISTHYADINKVSRLFSDS